MATKTKARNPQDTTLRNNRARQREIAALTKQLHLLSEGVITLRGRVFELEQKVGENDGKAKN
jgi:hypothetical protein